MTFSQILVGLCFFFYTKPNFHCYYIAKISQIVGPLGQAISIKKMAHWFFSKLIFTKCQLTIIIKIHKLLHTYSFYLFFTTNRVAEWQSVELASQGSQVLISLMPNFFSRIILKIHSEDFENVKKNLKKKI